MAFTGQLLRWNQDAYWAVVVGAAQAARAPLIGDWLTGILFAGQSVGGATLTLAISPSAGLFGTSVASTSGVLPMGKTRYINLDQCIYRNGATQDLLSYFVAVTPNSPAFSAGTGTSNSPASAPPTCGGGNANYVLNALNSGVVALDLLGQRYLNLNQCIWVNATINDRLTYTVPVTPNNPLFSAGTNSSNTPTGAPPLR
jgi:hypothetical protein